MPRTLKGPCAMRRVLLLTLLAVSSGPSAGAEVVPSTAPAVVTTVGLTTGPRYIGVNATTNRFYVANHDNDTVLAVDGATDAVLAVIPVGHHPRGVGVDPSLSRVYVANYGGDSVSVIDSEKNEVIATVPVGFEPVGIDVNPLTHRVYVANDD